MELAILSSKIFTSNPKQPWVEAVLIGDNRIQAVGSNADIEKAASPGAKRLELKGRLITPGLVDAHCHFLTLGMSFTFIDLRNIHTLEACRRKIKESTKNVKDGEWVIGRSWNHHLWEDKREPTRFDLDDILPHNPAIMKRVCGHSIWTNTEALNRCGVKADTPDPPGAKIDKNPETGEPTGLIREATFLIENHIPSPSREQWKSMALAAQEQALRLGLTGVHSCESLEQAQALLELDQEGKLKIRVYHLLPPEDLKQAADLGIKPGQGSEHVWFGHVKMFADGSLGANTALMHEPYSDDPAQFGLAYLSKQEMEENITLAYSKGYHIAIHAIGDKAVSNVLEAINDSRKNTAAGSKRDRIEHVQLITAEDLNAMKEMDVTASIQPVFVSSDWEVADKKWGKERCQRAYAWKTMLDKDIRLQFGSDAPVESINPLLGIQAAVTRLDRAQNPPGGWIPDQKLTLEESLAGFTTGAAYTSGREKDLGSIETGKLADLTILEEDLSIIPPEDWPEIQIEKTIIAGEIVYNKNKC